MATTAIEKQNPKINDGYILNDANVASIDTVNGNSFTWDQFAAVIIQNTDSAALDVQILSTTDSAGKSKTISLENISANSFAIINLLDSDFPVNGEIIINYNHASGTATSGKIIPMSFTKP